MLQHATDRAGAAAAGPPPTRLADVSLFFDFDGTLVELTPRPDGVIVSAALLTALDALAERLPGRIAIVSGRSLEQLDALLGDFAGRIAVAGSHGAEHREPGVEAVVSERSAGLTHATDELAAYAAAHGLLAERKTLGFALHFREAPDRERAALSAATAIAERHGVVLQRGKMMLELRADGDKGAAVTTLLGTAAMAGTRPLFFGDDLTDEDGFAAAAAAGGDGVLIGDRHPTHARYRLPDVAAVEDWIDRALENTA